jgi:VIT1/CCC1 family predicted Fe2+/Mn2+ transporter
MAIGDFLSTKSENEYHRAEREREAWEVENYPAGEKKELVELYTDKGMTKTDAETIVSLVSKYKNAWIDIMMVEELGIIESTESPLKNAVVTFISFAVFGLIPILAYVLAYPIGFFRENTFAVACALTLLTLFTLGAVKVKVTGKNFLTSGLETVSVGGFAAFAAYLVGHLLRGLAGA